MKQPCWTRRGSNMGIDGNNPVAAGRRVTAVTAAAACLWMAVVVAVVGATETASSSSSLLWPSSSSSSAFSFTDQRTVLRRAEDAAGGKSDTAQLLHFELRPTAALVQERLVQHEGRRRRRRRRRRHHNRRNVRKLVAADGGSDDEDDGMVQDKQFSSILHEDGGAENGDDTDDELEPSLPEEWFHPYSRAVYATLHPPAGILDDEMDDDDEEADETVAKQKAAAGAAAAAAYEDFVKYRHLSRYERQLRLALQLDLHPHWHGNYSDTPFYGDGNMSPMDRLTNEYYDLTTLDATDHNESNRNEADLPPLVSSRSLTRTSTRNGTNDGSGTASNQRDDRERRRRHRRRHLLESLVGGKFDNYQGVPLSQGYGTHYVHLWVGSPTPQRQSVIVDTGSHFTGFPVQGCSGCGERHHTDPHFDPSKSESFRPLRCPFECLEDWHCDARPADPSLHLAPRHVNEPRCMFKQAYTEGSSWTAYQAKDIVYCGGTDLIDAVDPTDTKYSIPFVFGCLQANTGLFVTQLADGIMGMSAHELTLPKQLHNAGKLEYNMFAMCFRREMGTSKKGVTAGSMTLGGVSSALDTSPMVYAKNIQPFGWFTVFIQAMYVARNGGSDFLFDSPESTKPVIQIPIDQSSVNVGRGVIVDSGTTDTYINSSIKPAFVKIWKQVTGMDYTHGPVYLTQSQLERLPTLLIQMRGAGMPGDRSRTPSDQPIQPVLGQAGYLDTERWTDLLLAIPATNYMEYSPTLKVYTSRLFFTETRGGVLGANAMQGHNVLFDWQHGRIGFAKSSCAYDLIAGKNDNHESFTSEGYSSECILATDRPILTQTCMDSVNIAICEASDQPTNVDISGMEIWTLIVEAPGDPGSCEAAILEWSEEQHTVPQIDPSVTNCTHDGLCQEFRPCHVPCMKAIAFYKRKRKNLPTNSEAVTVPHDNTYLPSPSSPELAEAGCNDWEWSACDHSCRQARIISTRISIPNGQYCVETDRDRRNCHVDACGRSDPCVVPFLVHAILLVEGNANAWTPEYQEAFREKLTVAAHSTEVSGGAASRQLFEEGDVNILVARPWYGEMEDDEYSLQDEAGGEYSANSTALGIQMILQISISNPKAKSLPAKTRGRKLLQEVGVLWTNITSVFWSPQPSSMCDPLDLYPLAEVANTVANSILPRPEFAATLATDLTEFTAVKLVSSWTIGTQVYDDYVNYFGPLASSPFFLVMKLLHEAFILMTLMWLGMCLCKSARLFRVCFVRATKQWQHRYDPVSADDDHVGEVSKDLDSHRGRGQAEGVELTVTHMRSTATKRRNSTISPDR